MDAFRCLRRLSRPLIWWGLFSICLVMPTGGFCAAPPSKKDAAETVKRLYRDYSWEATMIDAPDPWIGDAPKAVLEQYFDHDLAALWIKSRACTGGDCSVDWVGYDPLWDSMDPTGFYNVTVRATDDRQVVKVDMDATCAPGLTCKPADATGVHLIYSLHMTAVGWRISDIRSEVHGSLKAALWKALSEH